MEIFFLSKIILKDIIKSWEWMLDKMSICKYLLVKIVKRRKFDVLVCGDLVFNDDSEEM